MKSRRDFLKNASLSASAGILLPWTSSKQATFTYDFFKDYEHADATSLATDEDFWSFIQQSYATSSNIINLNNGGVAPAPKSVQDAVERMSRMANEAPSYYMWRIMDQGREPLRKKLGDLAGVSNEEVALHRNATEALENIIFGLRLQAGDEVILCKQDYPNMINSWKQREKRDGIKLVWLNHSLPEENNAIIVKAYVDAITPKTKVIHLT
ncbi:MAG: aminotransferase class V-fold PLP-dependent enzyme, partial [Saprospiraceae bacterium]